MTQRPILFSGEMVRAIKAGRKTQTRRLVKPRHDTGVIVGPAAEANHAIETWGGGARHIASHTECLPSPYGKPGDQLWVRETWLNNALAGYEPVWFYRADDTDKPTDRKWKPSIFMPRQASRITLEIEAVRVERLREISMADVIKEGCILSTSKTEPLDYQNLWESINGHESWQANPWVWVVTFKDISNTKLSNP